MLGHRFHELYMRPMRKYVLLLLLLLIYILYIYVCVNKKQNDKDNESTIETHLDAKEKKYETVKYTHPPSGTSLYLGLPCRLPFLNTPDCSTGQRWHHSISGTYWYTNQYLNIFFLNHYLVNKHTNTCRSRSKNTTNF
jgi:cbb3-type cytochrome oxidase subunit 3